MSLAPNATCGRGRWPLTDQQRLWHLKVRQPAPARKGPSPPRSAAQWQWLPYHHPEPACMRAASFRSGITVGVGIIGGARREHAMLQVIG